jgi:hypothetical protein
LWGFSLLGPGGAEGNAAKLWQLPAQNDSWDIGYNRAGDIGAPVDLLEGYRWNIPEITYAYDSEFRRFFGTNGIKAVEEAIRILNQLPAANRMSQDLTEFPLSTAQLNHEAAHLGLIDLKSAALQILVEQLGLADSIRWTFALRERINLPSNFGIYTVIKYNYDPVTLRTSSYVNGTLWTYRIFEAIGPNISDAQEELPANTVNEPVNLPVSSLFTFPYGSGLFFNGLTRDDAGGLRFLYHPRNVVTETLLGGTIPGSPSGWIPFIGTNFLGSNVVITNIVGGTNNIATAGLRGGINKIRFRQVFFDSILGQGFTAITNVYADRVVSTNSQLVSQVVRRPILVPDIIFTVEDTFPTLIGTRSVNWFNNDLINGFSTLGGPGVIGPPVLITFNTQLPFLRNQTPFFITEPSITDTNARLFLGLIGPTWASFDGTTNPPVIYPAYLDFDYIRSLVRGAGQ